MDLADRLERELWRCTRGGVPEAWKGSRHLAVYPSVEELVERVRRIGVESDVLVDDLLAVSERPEVASLVLAVAAAPLARRAGQYPFQSLYDYITAGEGPNASISFMLNYNSCNLETAYEMMANPNVISGLGDGGAHVRLICDASQTTFQLAFWTRDRKRGPKLPLEYVVRKLTHDGAKLYGMNDRGLIKVGKRADINVLDYANLNLGRPEMHFDLPSGAPRIHQGSTGYLATLVNGQATRRNDQDTGARPGRVYRSRAN